MLMQFLLKKLEDTGAEYITVLSQNETASAAGSGNYKTPHFSESSCFWSNRYKPDAGK